MTTNGRYPRMLRPVERDLLDYVLPADRPGYQRYRSAIDGMMVIGAGRRGPGNIVLGDPDAVVDLSEPLAPVAAYGALETASDTYSVTVREMVGRQIDVEIVSSCGSALPAQGGETRRWTFSSWLSGKASPGSGSPVREVAIGAGVTLALCYTDRRMWIHDRTGGMVLLIPITGFYSELMAHLCIRDPKIALSPGLLYDDPGCYTDADLRGAFIAYNRAKPRVELGPTSPPTEPVAGSMLRRILRKIW